MLLTFIYSSILLPKMSLNKFLQVNFSTNIILQKFHRRNKYVNDYMEALFKRSGLIRPQLIFL